MNVHSKYQIKHRFLQAGPCNNNDKCSSSRMLIAYLLIMFCRVHLTRLIGSDRL
jgi:hypothetical protein